MTLFTKDDRPLKQLLEAMNYLSPEFQFWARHTLKTGWLEKLIEILIRTGQTADKKEALEYLDKFHSPNKWSDLKIAKGDFSGKVGREPFRLLEDKLGYGRQDPNPYPHYGVVGHKAIADLLSGKIPNYTEAMKMLRRDQDIFQQQGCIFKTKTAPQFQPSLFRPIELFPQTVFVREILPNNHFSARLENEIVEWWTAMSSLIASHPSANWMKLYSLFQPLMPELEIRLWPIFHRHTDKLKSDQAFSQYLKYLTLMSLASLIPWSKKHRFHLFREIPALTNHARVNGGRIDAIEVLNINGHPPDKTEEELLKKMSDNSYSSVGHLVSALRRVFGRYLEFRITDWKFMLGDGVEQGRIIQPAEVKTPPDKHIRQVQSYVALANLDCYLRHEDNQQPWTGHLYFSKVRVVYILPTSLPVVHEFEVSSKQQQKIFQEEIVTKLHFAKKYAILRNYNNTLIGHIVGMLDSKEKQTKPPNGFRKKNPLFPEREAQSRLQITIKKYRRFADERKIIEITKRNKDGNDMLLLHLDKLGEILNSPESGGIKSSQNFNLETGGFISCLVHTERTPSMRLNIQEKFFKCFGCGIFGPITSLEQVLPLGHQSFRTVNIYFGSKVKKISQIIIPDEHHRIMQTAQRFLNDQFKISSSRSYVIHRGIAPELACHYGAGYGNAVFIKSLLENYSLDELIFYGFAMISDKVPTNRGLCPLLANMGMSIDQMKRETTTGLSKLSKVGLPYSVLEGRLTFPLIFENRYTNFYGRAAWDNCPSRSKHRKLSTSQTKVLHGIFNPQPLDSDTPEVIVTEGVFDCLSLIQMGWPNTTAIIGVHNRLHLEAIAHAKKNLAIALDYDQNQTGQTNTAKIMDYLQQIKHEGATSNFTKDFMIVHPDFIKWGCKDFNEYLIKKM